MNDSPRFSLNEVDNALDYLNRARQFIAETQDDPIAWKWAFISLHGALYGFAVTGCTERDDVVKRNGHLVDVSSAIKICLEQRGLPTPGGKPYSLTDDQNRAIERLREPWRNKFVHFHPGTVGFHLKGLPELASHVLDAIRYIAVEVPLALPAEQANQVEKLVSESKALLMARE